MRQHCTDGSFRFCRWRTHTEALSEDSGPEALSTQGQYFALQVFYEILEHIAGELSSNCCRTITMTRYRCRGEHEEKHEGGMTIMILVTGAAGRLGRLVVGRLIERGYDVLGTDRLPYDDSPSPFIQA